MDKRKSSYSKRCKVESTNNKKNKVKDKKSGKKEKLSSNEDNTNQDGNQSFCEKDSDKYELEMNKAHRINSIDTNADIEYKSLDDDVEEGQNNKKKSKKKSSCPSWNEELKYKNVQNQSKLSDKNLIDENSKRNKSHYRKDIDSPKDTCKSITKEGEENWKNKSKTNNVQNQSKLCDKNLTDENSKRNKSHYKKDIDSPKDTCKSITKEGEEKWKNKSINNNGQKQSRFSDMGMSVLDEIDEDIFNLPNDYSLAHCVAEDLRMGAGIAVDFKRIFGGVGKLADQKLKIGDVGIVKRHDQYAFYLVTKKTSNGKPTMITMEKALYSLLNKMKEYNLTKLGIPKIGCGLDKLDWSETKLLINNIFSGSGIHIIVCVPSKLLESKTLPKLKVYITPKHLWEMESETIIILFIDLEQIYKKKWTDHILDKVDAKYPFKENLLRDVKNKKFEPGEIISYDVKNEVIICMFITQRAYYNSIENGFKNIGLGIKRYKYMAIQSGPIDYPNHNFHHIYWIVLISRSVIYSSELWLCGNVNQTKDQVHYDEYCKNVQNYMNNSFQYSSPTQKNNFFSPSFNTK